MHREDFVMLNSDIIYFDNAATTLKPKVIMKETNDYYNKYTANVHRGGYSNGIIVDAKYENAREVVKDLIKAKSSREIFFTSGTTDSLNKIIFGYFKNYLKKNDEVILTKSEHASNVLPWYELAKEKEIKIKFAPLDEYYHLTLDNLIKTITPKTKVISIAHITNVIGDIRPIEDIIKYAHQKGILVVIDGAQSVPHIPIDVVSLDVDFLTFSAHKMCGPTGVGIVYGKEKLLNEMKPIVFGGGMNINFDNAGNSQYDSVPNLFEAGTPNIAGVIAFADIINYLNSIGLDNIYKHDVELKNYVLSKLKENKNIIIYNEKSDSGIITFNYKNIDASLLADYLNYYNICVRAGSHCAKILNNEFKIDNTCRISFYFYNTFEEIDKLIEVLNNIHHQ